MKRTLRVVGAVAYALIGWSGFCLFFGVHPTDDTGVGTLLFAVGGGLAGGALWNASKPMS